jgi:hypothetical protein
MLPFWIRACRLIFGITALVAIAYNLTHLDEPNFWSFFTNQSNLLGGVVLVLGALVFARLRNPVWWDVTRGVALISLLVTGIVYAALLGGIYNPFTTTEHTWASSIMHQLIPVIMLLDMLMVPLAPRTPRWTVILYILYPLIYLGWALLNGSEAGWYPYGFVNPNEYDNGYVGVLTTCGALLAVFVLIGLAIIGYSRVRRTPGYLQAG